MPNRWEQIITSLYGQRFGFNVDGDLVVDGDTVSKIQRDDSGYVRGIAQLGSDIGSNMLLIGTATRGAGKEIFQVARTDTNADAVARPTMAYFEHRGAPASPGTYDFHAVDVKLTVGTTNANLSANTGVYAVEGKAAVDATAGQTIGRIVGVYGTAINASASGTVTTAIGVQADVQTTVAGGTITNAVGIWVKTPTVSAGTLTSAYGLFIQNITGASTNYAIQTNQGRINFFAGTAPPAGGTAGVGITMSSTNNLGVFFGSGAPTLAAAKGSLYLRTDGSGTGDRMYVNTNGSTAWTAVTTAS